jgi:hypothetical protein
MAEKYVGCYEKILVEAKVDDCPMGGPFVSAAQLGVSNASLLRDVTGPSK